MNKEEIIQLIDKKIEEHKEEVFGSQAMSDKLQSTLSTAKDKMKNPSKDGIVSTMKLAILKDKIIFHDAAMKTLQNLKDDILRG